ncbi:MAG: extracellular solute-binding protein, partial [Firmicutes bacterium]|nr:extracellular solute-binding protein [Bacillota bacterium]
NYLLEETLLRPSLAIRINDEVQYNEMFNLELPLKWAVDTEPLFDRFGDEITPNSSLYSSWETISLTDPNYFFTEPLKFYLEAGENQVSILVNEGYILFGDITIGNLSVVTRTYSEYQALVSSALSIDKKITVEAERYIFESKQNIRAKFQRNPALTPYSYKNRVLNVLDQTSYRKSGDSVTYTFDVEEAGLYNLSFNYLQSENEGLFSSRLIMLDGEVPFIDLESYGFPYSRNWANETLHRNGVPYDFYLSAGTHTLTMTAVNSNVNDVYHQLVNVLSDINDLAREVNKITGGLTDRYRNYKLEVYIPNIVSELTRLRDEIVGAKTQLIDIYQSDNTSIVSELNVAIKYMNQFIENPNEIPPFQSRFNVGDTSIYGRINIILPRLIDNPLQLDKIYVHGEGMELPKPNANLFVRVWEGIKAFTYSFFDPKYNQDSSVDDQTVEVWVRNSRLYIEVMQRMIDEEFTPVSGIKVQLSVMPDENKIVLANAAGTTPDAAMGLSVTRPFEFALRGIVSDLSELDGFYELSNQFNSSSFIPFVYEEGVYSIPETQDVKLLFYRKDVLEFLGVEPPQTWEEVVSLIPIMQKYNYYFYTPLGGDNAFKTFGETTPFIYQFGGVLYNETGDKTVINEDESYDAFEFMTDLFSVYNVPITTSNFFQKFRDGQTPLGIGDGNTYIQLKYAAPELAGQWGVIPIPGIETDKDETTCPGPLSSDGRCIERWDPTYGTSSIIFSDSSKQDLAWEYFKWWFEKDVQSEFTYQLQSLLGDEFLYMTANIEAFRTSAWPSDSKYEVLEQWEWVRTTGRVPGDYLLERELSNAWNKVVNDGDNARAAIDDAVIIINRELKRKLTEFGYFENGVMIKPYVVPTSDTIHLWLERGGN